MSVEVRDRLSLARRGCLMLALALLGCLTLSLASAQATPLEFGVSSFETSLSTFQAGAHPDLEFGFTMNLDGEGEPVDKLRDLHVTLPTGLIGNTRTMPRCTAEQFSLFACQPSAQIGMVHMLFNIPEVTEALPIPLYNMTPASKHLATFAGSFLFAKVVVQVDLASSGGLDVTVEDFPTILPIVSTSLDIWGVPAGDSHDLERWRTQTGGPQPIYGEPNEYGEPKVIGIEPTFAGVAPTPFLTNSTDCSALQRTEMQADSYQAPGKFTPPLSSEISAPTGCEELNFKPSLDVQADTTRRDTPAGYDIDLENPMSEGPYELATPDIRKLSVTLPEGTSFSPSVGVGLTGCSDAQYNQEECPNSSKVGTIAVHTPLLSEELIGSIYIGSPLPETMFRVFVHAAAQHVSINLKGVATPNPLTGQVTIAFDQMPQLPFDDLRMHVFNGAEAAFSNPLECGPAVTSSRMTAWGGSQAAPSSQPFTVDSNGFGAACPTVQPFQPSMQSGTVSPTADSFTPLETTITRPGGQQTLSTISLTLPEGLLADLASVPQCGEEDASKGTCPSSSSVGSATIGAGSGEHPLWNTGHVYLTGPYEGAPFGLSIVVPAVSGPFNLGEIVVRAKITIDPRDLHLTIDSDPLPTIRDGIPLRIQTVHLSIDRPGFIFNPTNCAPRSVLGTFTSTTGASSTSSEPFQLAGCAGLAFKPTIKISTHKYPKIQGAPLNLTFTSGPGQDNLGSVKVELPKQLQARLSTLQKACLAATYEANPSSCPAQSVMGSAAIVTPVLGVPLTGPVYLVTYGRSANPTLSMTLSGEGVDVHLTGKISVSGKSITSSTFSGIPDAPIDTFSLNLTKGPNSLLGQNGKLCGSRLLMPTTLIAQSGRQIKRYETISAGGCPKHKPAKKSKKKSKKAKKKKKKRSKKGK